MARHNIRHFSTTAYSTLQMIHVGMNRFVLKMIGQRNLTTNHSDLVVNESLVWLISLLQTIEDFDTVKSE